MTLYDSSNKPLVLKRDKPPIHHGKKMVLYVAWHCIECSNDIAFEEPEWAKDLANLTLYELTKENSVFKYTPK